MLHLSFAIFVSESKITLIASSKDLIADKCRWQLLSCCALYVINKYERHLRHCRAGFTSTSTSIVLLWTSKSDRKELKVW